MVQDQLEGRDHKHRLGSDLCTADRKGNVNRSAPSLDLMVHSARELGSGLLLVSEPNHIPDSPGWFASLDHSAAIFVDANLTRLRCTMAVRGSRFVAVNCGPYLVISLYAPPSIGLIEFNALLDELSGAISSRVEKVILTGDFNAKASTWGARVTDRRGLLLTSSDLFRASLNWRAGNPTLEDPMDITQVVRWLDSSMEEACDVAAPRIGLRRPRRKAYWWCESVADLRHQCIRARRCWQRA
ncbi:reverse transcriptase, partial [Lasius niger]